MDLQSQGCRPVTSANAWSTTNFRAYSPQTADVSRGQPNTSGRGNAPTVVASEGRICLPLRIRDRSQPSNAIEGATKVPHGGSRLA